ncbi:CHAT domain-containing protein [Planktothrix tepida]|uniref:CHAT domain-containing protein n=1 Tax=Planktothrix tepida TaxID=1678309 RepID=UPI0016488E27|nr:CHAT domain-containing protein [Planktothrix tepida]
MAARFNQWLRAETFLSIRNKLFKINPSEEALFIIETEEEKLQRLPWHLWEFFERYPKVEIAFSAPQFDRPSTNLFSSRTQGRLLAILGDSKGIDLEEDRIALEKLPDIEIVMLVEPTSEEFSKQLWDYRGWDILFFAGHSVTETSNQQGKIFINPEESRTISQLKHSLQKAVSSGLKLAIFNSCDGLKIAKELAELHIPYVIAMREPVPDIVAQVFLKYFLSAFSQGHPLHLAVREARKKLQSIEADFPGASGLPVLFQNPSLSPFTWQDLPGIGVESKMFNWVVMLTDTQEDLPETMGRRALYQAGKERTTEFQRGLENWLRKKGAMSEVKAIAPPTTFPVIMLKCTHKVARLIESYPGVDFVLPDGENTELIL